MSGRPKIFDIEKVVEKATDVFWQKGYEATSTDEALAAMGIGKGSFYLAFAGGKKELFEKVLEQFSHHSIIQLKQALEGSEQPVEVIRSFFRSIAQTPIETHQKGCFLGNTIAELANVNKPIQDKAVELLKQLENLFYETVRKAQEKGQLETKEDPALIARYLLNLWNGINITRRMYPDASILQPLIEMQLSILK